VGSAAVIRDGAGLVERLRGGDEAAFEKLVESYYGTMLAVAQSYVKTRAVAEEFSRMHGSQCFRGSIASRDVAR
jgi:hypothetical protein